METRNIRYGAPLSLIVSAVLLTGCGDDSVTESTQEAPAVGVIEVAMEPINPSYDFVGRMDAYETVELRARVEGFLRERAFAEGQGVKQDQLLFSIEPERYEAALAQAKASLASNEAALARAELEKARLAQLEKTQNVSKQALDDATANELSAAAAVQSARAGVQSAELDLSYTTIEAPLEGVISRSNYDVGNLVGPQSGVMATIRRMDPIEAVFSVSETVWTEAARVAAQQSANLRAQEEPRNQVYQTRLRFQDGEVYPHIGTFNYLDNQVDEGTGTVQIRARFPNPNYILLPGQFVTVMLERIESEEAIVIPQATVLTDQLGNYVLVVDEENKVNVRRIQTGRRVGPRWMVQEGLAEGERVILQGLQKVRPGIVVNPEVTAQTPLPAGSEG